MATTTTFTTTTQAFHAYVEALTEDLAGNPPEASKPFRRVIAGPVAPSTTPRPFLSVWITKLKTLDAISRNAIIEATIALRVSVDVLESDPHPVLLDLINTVGEKLDQLTTDGLIDGAIVTDQRDWTINLPESTTAARIATAQATTTIVLRTRQTTSP